MELKGIHLEEKQSIRAQGSSLTAMRPYNVLPVGQRIYSIDVLRGLTIMLMVFVNEVAGVKNIPEWLKHLPADVDGMTIVDWVFPAFLFIVGMSIPLSINNRIQKGDNFWKLQKHILVRTLGLLVLGVLMVNAEGGRAQGAMIIPISVWSLLIYPFAILVWNVYTFENKIWAYLLRGLGIAGLVALALMYRGGEDGTGYLQPKWWGILGLIGWSYFAACIFYQLFKGNKYYLMMAIALCTLVFIAGKTSASELTLLEWTRSVTGHSTHTAIVLSGIVLTLIFFDQSNARNLYQRIREAWAFGVILFIAGFLLRPYFAVGKIGATPSWGLYSSAFAMLAFLFLYWLTDLKQINRWTKFFQPAAAQPLLTYIIPFILWASYATFNFYPLPNNFRTGIFGVMFCIAYAAAVVLLARALIKLKIRLQL